MHGHTPCMSGQPQGSTTQFNRSAADGLHEEVQVS